MPRLRLPGIGAVLASVLLAACLGVVRAGEPSPPPLDPATAAAVARGRELGAEVLRLQEQGKSAEATPLAREALATLERARGEDHPDVATALDNLASVLQDQAVLREARPLYERALAIRERTLGPDHLLVAESTNNLATLLHSDGAYPKARLLYERAIAIRERALGRDDPSLAPLLNNLADLLRIQGEYATARPVAERALAIKEKSLGSEDPSIATSLNNLAALLDEQGAYGEATVRYARAVAIFEKAHGADHPLVATGLNNLAEHHRVGGEYGLARPLFARSLAIWERSSGRDHPNVATSLGNLGLLLRGQGAYAEARPLFERALAIREAKLGSEHPEVGTALANFADLLMAQGEYVEARPLLERAVRIHERALGATHPSLATSLTALARDLEAQGAFAEAEPLLDRALAIRDRVLGKDHPDVAASLDARAWYLRRRGRRGEARAAFERALEIRGRAFGGEHAVVAASLASLASLLEAEGSIPQAHELFARSLSSTVTSARAQFAALSPQQRLGLLRSTRHRLDDWIRFAPRVGLSGYAEVLQLRGLVGRAEAGERVLSRRTRGEDRRTLASLQAAQRRAARLANQVPSSFKPSIRAAWQREYAEASAERERSTLELTKRLAPLRAAVERQEIGVAGIQARLGAETALVDFLRVGDRYLAWIVRAEGGPVRIDVGAAAAIEQASSALVDAITADRDATGPGTALRVLAWDPIAAELGEGVKGVVMCPDAALAAVPFGALPGKAPGTYLLDEFRISYVMSAQDLVPWQDAPPSGTGALVVGGVDYEHADPGTRVGASIEGRIASTAVDRAPWGDRFTPLPQTRLEAETLRDRLGRAGTTLVVGASATESRVREAARGKRFVHVATHGFAREDLLAGLYTRKIDEAFTSADAERQLAVGHDPMLLSGLAMAGANPREGGTGDDGILTALEASYLDLDGVELVTLSACSTARGTAESGEGVQGLVQAFQMAGARRVVASLWKVDDEATRRLMEGLYERMLRKANPLAPADALREAAIALRDTKDPSGKARFAAPRYWAPFVAYGR